jgi:hypothetical protein
VADSENGLGEAFEEARGPKKDPAQLVKPETKTPNHIKPMNRKDTNRREALLRVKQFGIDHPLTPANAGVTALQTSIAAVITEIDTHSGDQDTGRGLSHGGAGDRRRIAKELRALMRRIADIGKTLDPEAFPGVAQQLRMPGNSYPVLETRARAFLEVVTPIKAAFVDRLMPADFDEQLQALIDDFAAARERKHTGRAEQVGGTAGISDAAARGMRLARKLDAILKVAYAKNPSLLAAWKSAVKVQRGPQAVESPGTTPPAAPAPTA